MNALRSLRIPFFLAGLVFFANSDGHALDQIHAAADRRRTAHHFAGAL